MNETVISTVYDAISNEMVTGYMFSEVYTYLTIFGQGIAIAGTLFILTLIAWDLVRHFMEAREVPDYE